MTIIYILIDVLPFAIIMLIPTILIFKVASTLLLSTNIQRYCVLYIFISVFLQIGSCPLNTNS